MKEGILLVSEWLKISEIKNRSLCPIFTAGEGFW